MHMITMHCHNLFFKLKAIHMLKIKKLFTRNYHFLGVTFLITTFSFITYNLSFHQQIFNILNDNQVSCAFKILSPLDVYSLYVLLYLALFSYKPILKPVSYILFLISSIASYMVDNYGIFFNVSMIQNVFQTNKAEAFSYFSWQLFFYVIALGVVPCLILHKIKISYPSLKRTQLQRWGVVIALTIFSAIVTVSYYQQFSFIGRENRWNHQQIQPYSYIVATFETIKQDFFTTPPKYIQEGNNAKIISSTKKKLMIVVVGETARIQNYAYAGYNKNTNQYTQSYNLINFKNIKSCGTATAISVPCMFTDLTHDTFSTLKANYRDNVFDIIKKAGFEVTWYENDGGCKGMCQRIKTVDIHEVEKCKTDFCFDETMLKYVKNDLKQAYDANKDSLIVLHINGSHGPRYYERYPQDFAKFKPECRRADVENCQVNELINTYDNTILYTDYILAQLIKELQAYEKDRAVSLLYISDHGESLGEDGVFLHGLPYALAPKYQTHVPMQIYFGQNTLQAMGVNEECLRNAVENNYSHDNLFHTLLSILQIQTSEYQKNLDILANCKA